jgi:Tryptophan halogenase
VVRRALPGGHLVVSLMSDGDLVRDHGWADPAAWEASLAATVHIRAWATAARSRFRLTVSAAGSQVLEPVTGETWVAAGDAACAFDPLSSAGILSALRTGREAAEALTSMSSSTGLDVVGYGDRIRRRFAAYLQDRRLFYCSETRWDTEFWARRRDDRYQPH